MLAHGERAENFEPLRSFNIPAAAIFMMVPLLINFRVINHCKIITVLFSVFPRRCRLRRLFRVNGERYKARGPHEKTW
jgi:hypothetical protein